MKKEIIAIFAILSIGFAATILMNTALAAKGEATLTRHNCAIESGSASFIVEGHLVEAPSGNSNLQCHLEHH